VAVATIDALLSDDEAAALAIQHILHRQRDTRTSRLHTRALASSGDAASHLERRVRQIRHRHYTSGSITVRHDSSDVLRLAAGVHGCRRSSAFCNSHNTAVHRTSRARRVSTTWTTNKLEKPANGAQLPASSRRVCGGMVAGAERLHGRASRPASGATPQQHRALTQCGPRAQANSRPKAQSLQRGAGPPRVVEGGSLPLGTVLPYNGEWV
jgi:hypothetical protein